VWDAATLKPLRVFTEHRDSVTAVCFRRGSNQLFTASRDRTVKIWSLDELAYVETLYGHQDQVVDVGALNQEKCVTVGARDRTARYWRVVEESQLVFRGGGAAGSKRRKEDGESEPESKGYNEGSIDRIVMVDDETFVTGSDNGSLSLWNTQKKKAVFVYPTAHGLQPSQKPEDASAEMQPRSEIVAEPQARWITALASLPFSNVILSGSWDGQLRAWKITEDKRRLELVGTVGTAEDGHGAEPNGIPNGTNGSEGEPQTNGRTHASLLPGVINDIAVFEKGTKGKDGFGIAVVAGKQHRLGSWLNLEGRNCGMVFDLPRRT